MTRVFASVNFLRSWRWFWTLSALEPVGRACIWVQVLAKAALVEDRQARHLAVRRSTEAIAARLPYNRPAPLLNDLRQSASEPTASRRRRGASGRSYL